MDRDLKYKILFDVDDAGANNTKGHLGAMHRLSSGLNQLLAGNITSGFKNIASSFSAIPAWVSKAAVALGGLTLAFSAGWAAGKKLEELTGIGKKLADWLAPVTQGPDYSWIDAYIANLQRLDAVKLDNLKKEIEGLADAHKKTVAAADAQYTAENRREAARKRVELAAAKTPEEAAGIEAKYAASAATTERDRNAQQLGASENLRASLQAKLDQLEKDQAAAEARWAADQKAGLDPTSGMAYANRAKVRDTRAAYASQAPGIEGQIQGLDVDILKYKNIKSAVDIEMQAAGAEHKKKLDDIAKARQEDLAKPALSRPGLESPRTQVVSQLHMLDRLNAISAGRAPTDNAAREALDLQRKQEDLAKPALSRPVLESPRTQVVSQLNMLDRLNAISAGRAPTDNAAREALDLQRKMAADLAIIAKNSGGVQ